MGLVKGLITEWGPLRSLPPAGLLRGPCAPRERLLVSGVMLVVGTVSNVMLVVGMKPFANV